MTFCKTLKEAERPDGYTIIAEEKTEKFDNFSCYVVYVCKGSLALSVHECTKNTWRRKVKQLAEG